MSDLVAARLEMALSLAFHIVFAAFGIAMPLFMFVAEAFHLRTGEPSYVALTKRWAKGTAIFFAVGAVSGTVLSFELGLLWPGFMGGFGSVIGLPFALEGFAFFTEAIFLGIYLYGWDRVSPRLHCAAGGIVALSGLASAAFVVMANSWMNTPAGFRLDAAGKVVDVDPVAACLNPAAFHEIVHVLLSSYCACGFAVAGVNAWIVRRDPANALAKRALQIAFGIGGGAAILLPLSGHYSAQKVAVLEQEKLAALEGQFATEKGAPLRIGGFPDVAARTTRWAIEIPKGLSFLAFFDPNAEVKGLDAFAPDDQPDPRIVHPAFQLMVGLGSWLAALAAGAVLLRLWKKKDPWQVPPLLLALALSTPLGFAALEAGWVVTEAGRQPWIIKGVLRTRDAVTPVQGLPLELVLFVLVYVVLAFVVYKLGRWNLDHHHA
ncbi:MAG TPA: cytochrome ubiquinol oxidase subunit I [Planctomycetota bacterium]|nr:cytochrome ubiquinol oxidase subunit I [Planctomycetota bacterium]